MNDFKNETERPEPSFDDVREVLNRINKMVNNGDKSPIDAIIKLRPLIKLMKEVGDNITSQALEKVQENKEVTRFGWCLTERNGSTKYSYSHIPEWTDLKDRIKEIEEGAKESFKASIKGNLVADENGEIIPPAKPNYSKSSINFKEIKE